MNMSSVLSTSVVATLAVYLSATPSEALFNTFVASNGGGMTCSRAAPCANFQAALVQTDPGGDITCLDSGDFSDGDIVSINKSVTIDCGGAVGMQVFRILQIDA